MTRPQEAAAALIRPGAAIIAEAVRIIERDRGETNPRDVGATWLGVGTALLTWNDTDGKPHTLTVTGADARELHSAEGGSPSFPPTCRAEHDVDGKVVRCGLRSPHFPLSHDDLEGVRWTWPNG